MYQNPSRKTNNTMSKPKIEIIYREAEEKDLPPILEIMNDAILNTTSIYDYNPRNDEFVKDWFKRKQSAKMPILVGEADNHTVGYGTYGIFRAWDAYKFSVEHSIYVHKDYQGHGIGKQLMTNLIQRAERDGYHTMIAGIDALNTKSCQFHKQFGFLEVGRLK
ncbi:MAG: N-acetyltransferase family protein, partial [Bacteroidota bacterium]|nr:N-acetyltransferase family protein [Bacteroidota bacterium]